MLSDNDSAEVHQHVQASHFRATSSSVGCTLALRVVYIDLAHTERMRLLAASLLGKHGHACTTAACCLGVLALHLETPKMTQAPAPHSCTKL